MSIDCQLLQTRFYSKRVYVEYRLTSHRHLNQDMSQAGIAVVRTEHRNPDERSRGAERVSDEQR